MDGPLQERLLEAHDGRDRPDVLPAGMDWLCTLHLTMKLHRTDGLQFVGINALIYYSPTLFETMGLGSSMQLIMSGVLNVTQLIGVSTSVWTMDRFGRRPLLLTGAAFMTISHVIIAILVGIYSDNWPTHRPQGWTSVAFLFLYMLSFGASWGPVPWAMPSEIFPSSLRAKGTLTGLSHQIYAGV